LQDSVPNQERYKRALEKGYTEGELWKPDKLHENLPNTLGWAMVQIVPDPKTGEPVMFVGELQSRWGQTVQKAKQRAKEQGALAQFEAAPPEGHPLLDLHQSLVLKAVVAEAQKRGIKKIAVSDGETAMMTEMHDQAAGAILTSAKQTELEAKGYRFVVASPEGTKNVFNPAGKLAGSLERSGT